MQKFPVGESACSVHSAHCASKVNMLAQSELPQITASLLAGELPMQDTYDKSKKQLLQQLLQQTESTNSPEQFTPIEAQA